MLHKATQITNMKDTQISQKHTIALHPNQDHITLCNVLNETFSLMDDNNKIWSCRRIKAFSFKWSIAVLSEFRDVFNTR